MYWFLYDELIGRATRDEAELISARKTWEARTGTVSPDHELYHERSDAFVEWFLLDRRGADQRTPLERELAELAPPDAAPTAKPPNADLRRDPRWAVMLRALHAAQHSLFSVVRLRPGGLIVDDLLGGARFDVDERRSLPGVAAGDLFEARLIPDPEVAYRIVLGRAVLFHPREATPTLLRLAAATRRQGTPHTALLDQLLRLRLKALTYRHVSPARIYEGEPGTARAS